MFQKLRTHTLEVLRDLFIESVGILDNYSVFLGVSKNSGALLGWAPPNFKILNEKVSLLKF